MKGRIPTAVLVVLALITIGALAGSALLAAERVRLASEVTQLQADNAALKQQVTRAAEVQDENRRLRAEIADLKENNPFGRATPVPGTSPTPAPQATPAPSDPRATPAPTPPGANTNTLPPQTQAEMEQIGQQVIDIRGLEQTAPVDQAVLSQDELREYLIEEIEKESTPEEYQAASDQLWLLGLAPKDLDLKQLLLDLQTEQIAGFYDPDTKAFYIIGDSQVFAGYDKVVYAHEFNHHLQDQNFDLNTMLPDDLYDDDRALAIRTLVEGDATLLMQFWLQDHMSQQDMLEMLRDQSSMESPILDSAPAAIRESLIFPYNEGLSFVQRLYQAGGWEAVDAALRNPPLSTEQIMHPEKYDSERDDPTPVTLPDMSGALPGWTEGLTGTLGEFDFDLMLREGGLDTSEAADAAAGWDGGRFTLFYEPNSAPVLVATTAWDSEQEATQFADALASTMTQDGELFQRDDVYVAIKRQGDRVSLGFSPDRGLVERVLKALP